jgi:hypothetical protein
VQVYTYVLQPLMQGSMPRSRKKLDAAQKQRRGLQQQELQEIEAEQLQQEQQDGQLQQQLQQPMQIQGAAAQLLARLQGPPAAALDQQQQQQLPQGNRQPPDLGVADQAAAAAAGAADHSMQQQLEGQHSGSLARSSRGSLHRSSRGSLHRSSRGGSQVANCDDSSQSLALGCSQCKDLSRLTPEMARAAAAALPGAAGAEGFEGEGVFRQYRMCSSSGSEESHEEGGDSQDGGMHQGPVLVGWELRLVMEFCDAVSVLGGVGVLRGGVSELLGGVGLAHRESDCAHKVCAGCVA